MLLTSNVVDIRLPEGFLLVGLAGEIDSGKGYLSKVLVREHGYTPIAFANPFKADAVVLHGFPADEVYGSYRGPEVREHLQVTGQGMREVFGENHWIDYAKAELLYLIEHGVSKVVVTDVRYRNEVEAIQEMGGKVYKVIGRGGNSGEASKHISERELDGYTGLNGTIDNSIDGVPALLELLQRNVH